MVIKRSHFAPNPIESLAQRNRKQMILMKQKCLTFLFSFLGEFFELRLSLLTRSFSSQDDLSLEFSWNPLPRVWPRSLILPLIGWCHDRIDADLNEVRKLFYFFMEVENSRIVSTQVNLYVVFWD